MLLLTGFVPFTTGQGLKLTHNPTGDIALNLASTLPGVHGAVLPVSFTKTKAELRTLLAESQPTHWIGMGFAPHRSTIDVEVVALNLEHARSGDNDGETPTMKPILDEAPLAYRAQHDLEPLISALDGHTRPAQANFHAGTFLCNQVFFLGSHQVAINQLETATFIHVPPMEDYTAFEAALGTYIRNIEAPSLR